jgi:MFS family permease
MVMSAKICGKYSAIYGRKSLFLIGLFTVPVRCLLLYGMLVVWEDSIQGNLLIQIVILSTQLLDGIGAGTFGTMYILVTSDISGGTGRFSLILGMTTAAMSIGGTVSGYLGEALAEDLGYKPTFLILAIMSAVPALIYLVFMPETLPSLSKVNNTANNNQGNIHSIKEEDEDHASSVAIGAKSNYIEMY